MQDKWQLTSHPSAYTVPFHLPSCQTPHRDTHTPSTPVRKSPPTTRVLGQDGRRLDNVSHRVDACSSDKDLCALFFRFSDVAQDPVVCLSADHRTHKVVHSVCGLPLILATSDKSWSLNPS